MDQIQHPGGIPVVDVSCLSTLLPSLRDFVVSRDCAAASTSLRQWHCANEEAAAAAARSIIQACTSVGFFYISNYGIPAELEKDLDAASRDFFRLPVEQKMRIRMSEGGRAWRGYFPVGGELTSGMPDVKEGLYLGQEIAETDERVMMGVPMFGRNLFPHEPAQLRELILSYQHHCEGLGHGVTALIAVGLDLPVDFFALAMCADPLCLFRIFHYPPATELPEALRQHAGLWGVGEHTDYGLVTLLKQDDVGGLQVKTVSGTWLDAPPVPHTLVVNVGDMLEAISHGLLVSTPHRVKNTTDRMRLSFPFFFDPGFAVKIEPLPLNSLWRSQADAQVAWRSTQPGLQRWDNGQFVVSATGTYGAYFLGKVGKVFPNLASTTL
jgi:isopenicillin N synthase-like dioxygenase